METGTYISGLGHVAVIGWALLGGPLVTPDDAATLQVTDVEVISEAAFAALVSHAPSASTETPAAPAPEADANATTTPKADAATRIASLTPPATPQPAGVRPTAPVMDAPRADVQDAPPTMETPATDTVGATLITPTAPTADEDRAGREPDRLAMVTPSMRPAPRVDSTPAPRPEPDAERARETEEATQPDETATEPGEEKTPKAPEEASSEIVTEAKESETESAPVRTSRPKGRPADLADKARAAAAEIETAMNQAVADAADSGTTTPASKPETPRPAPSGPPLTQAETDGLRMAVQECWNVNPTSEAARVTVVIGFEMEKSGQVLLNTIRLISASDGSDAAKRSAYDAGRRAIIRCQQGGYRLPPEKFDHWKEVEVTFNPEKMRNR
jgi:hypothetical protein